MKYFLAVTLFAAIACAQSRSAYFGPPPIIGFITPLTGSPYSGDWITERSDTLPDGTPVTWKFPAVKAYRDSAGRTRTERPISGGAVLDGQVPQSPFVIVIEDPVAQVRYTLDTVRKVAHRQNYRDPSVLRNPVPDPIEEAAHGGGVPSRNVKMDTIDDLPVLSSRTTPVTTSDDLGTNIIEGITAHGFRWTTTWPNQPPTEVRELWTSTNPGVTIMQKSSNSASGVESTGRLTNISVGEPAPSLFQPPPDYTIVDEPGAFKIQWSSKP